MPRVLESHPDDATALEAGRSSEESNGNGGALLSSRSTENLAFQIDATGNVQLLTSQDRITVSAHSILANSMLGASRRSSDTVPSTQTPPPQPLRTSYFTQLASQMLNGGSSGSSGPMIRTLMTSPPASGSMAMDTPPPPPPRLEMDMISVESAPRMADGSPGPSASQQFARASDGGSSYDNSRLDRPLRSRLSSALSSVQREMETNAFTSPSSESAYMKMRKTLDPEALIQGDMQNPGANAVLSSLRPVANPFNLADAAPTQGFHQRGRAATTGTAPHLGYPSTLPPSNRSQRSWTVPGQPVGALANDPRGTFRTTTADTAQQIFAAQQVRLQNRWLTDVWIYMKNSHPFLGICTAHRWHPYKKKDRLLVLIVTLVLTLFVTGLYSTQECCTTSPDASVAVVSGTRQLLDTEYHAPDTHRRLDEDIKSCLPFNATCNTASSLCTLGSTCTQSKCTPTTPLASEITCSSNTQCPQGWKCSSSNGKCRPSASLLCYLPVKPRATSRVVAFAAEDEELPSELPSELPTDIPTETPDFGEPVPSSSSSGSGSGSSGSAPVDAISALANLLKFAQNSTNASTSSSSDASSSGSSSASGSYDVAVQQVLITLTKPTNGGVYGVSATIPIAWEVKIVNAERSFVDAIKFRVDFSKDGNAFDVLLASNVAPDSTSEAATTNKYHFDWDLANNESLTCTDCVLRVCTEPGDSTLDQVCIRTDGGLSSSDSDGGPLTASAASGQPKITFRIVRDILECACGIKFSSFVTYSYLIGLVIPVAMLLLEQFVTFYQDSKVFGMFARRGGPQMPVVGFYAAEATKRGRIFLGVVLIGLVFGCGMMLARINEANFMGSKGEIAVLWVVMFLLVVVIGFVYCSILYCVLFTVRWFQDEKKLSHEDFGAGDFGMFLETGRANNSTMLSQQQFQQYPHGGGMGQEGQSYQWPVGSIPTNSSRSNHSTIVIQPQGPGAL